MRKFIAILTTLILLLSVAACRSDEKSKSEQASQDNNTISEESSPTTDTNSDTSSNTEASSQTGSSSKPDSASSSQPAGSLQPGSSQPVGSSKPASSSQPTGSSKPSSSKPTNSSQPVYLTVNDDVIDYTIFYHADNNNTIETSFNTEYWKMPYGREDNGTLTRDGYVLLGYSFDKDGKGELIRPGYKYILPSKNSTQNLYCVWAKETKPASFKTIQKTSSTVYISSYTGSDKVVYIPREINGKTVTGIAANAFKNNKTLTEVHITSSILEVAENAFASCKNLKTVTLYDSLQTISDASFKDSPVKTVRICAGKTPRYANIYGAGIKYERLIKTQGKKRIIVLAGSSTLYGIETEYMESLFKDDYKVVNYGTNANMNLLFYLDAITPLLSNKDVVVYAPEQYGAYAYHTNGNPELPSATFQGLASCYNLFENVDASKYTNVFDNFGQYCVQSSRMPSLSWESHDVNINPIGDHAKITSNMNSPNYRYGANGYFRFNEQVIPARFINNLNRVIDNTAKTGAKILFSYPPHNRNNIEQSSLNEKSYDFYNKWISITVHCPLISDIRNYIYNGEYFANTDYHVNTTGRRMHTKQLADDIIKAGIGVK